MYLTDLFLYTVAFISWGLDSTVLCKVPLEQYLLWEVLHKLNWKCFNSRECSYIQVNYSIGGETTLLIQYKVFSFYHSNVSLYNPIILHNIVLYIVSYIKRYIIAVDHIFRSLTKQSLKTPNMCARDLIWLILQQTNN